MKPRNQLKKPVADILRDINRKSKAHEQMMSGHVLKIHPQYHKDLIGTKGSQVHRLQDRYNVRITFPRTTAIRDDQSAADSASETGAAHPTHRSRQGQDEVIVKGPRKGADEARDELLNLLQWVIDNSHTATVSVAQNQIPQLIGQGGREMEKIRMTTGAQVDIPDAKRDASNASGRVDIKLKGSKQQVQEAKQLLEERARTFDDSITRTLEIDRKYHRSLIGSGGEYRP
jgi:predicted PilT family ATPase